MTTAPGTGILPMTITTKPMMTIVTMVTITAWAVAITMTAMTMAAAMMAVTMVAAAMETMTDTLAHAP